MENNDTVSKPSLIGRVIGTIAAVAVAGGLIAWGVSRNDNPSDSPSPSPTPTSTPAVESKKKYKDGTYSATGNYSTPGGAEHMGVTLTLVDDTVTGGQIQNQGNTPTAKRMQTMFSNGFNAVVVGKTIDSVAVTVVNGSSLTPKGFMDALAKIKVQAAL